ncbi:hypothetical protein [Paraburkholderia sp. J76]|uniref:hypothetical protein n=1 Tax=Paraburkholderia sp. J76 TaxID=2805439 RepID=UPI002ABD6B66|nr:hypothetical protein [Paraburkholderia sp. J76]
MTGCHLTVASGTGRIFPNDYTRDELVQYIVTLVAQAYDTAENTRKLTARIRELEARLRACAPLGVGRESVRRRAVHLDYLHVARCRIHQGCEGLKAPQPAWLIRSA